MKKSLYVRHRSQNSQPEPNEIEMPVEDTEQAQSLQSQSQLSEMSDPNELDYAVEQTQAEGAVLIYSKGFDASLNDEIREEIKHGDGSTFFFDSENEEFPDSFSEDYIDFLLSYE